MYGFDQFFTMLRSGSGVAARININSNEEEKDSEEEPSDNESTCKEESNNTAQKPVPLEALSVSIENFTSKDSSLYQCKVCTNIPAINGCSEHALCGGIFCKKCLKECIENNANCPKCFKVIAKSDTRLLKSKNRKIWSFIGNLDMQCPSNSLASNEQRCEWSGKYCDLRKHYLNDCINYYIECKNKCGIYFQRWKTNEHMRECTNTMEKCTFCQTEVRKQNMEAHLTKECKVDNPQKLSDCPFANIGCQYNGKMESIKEHVEDQCSHFECLCNYLQKLSHQNDQIKARLDSLSEHYEQIIKYNSLFEKCKKGNLLTKEYTIPFTCNVCNKDCPNGKCWLCRECKFYVCKKCHGIAKLNSKYKCKSNPEHGLIPIQSNHIIMNYKCNYCCKILTVKGVWCPICCIGVCEECTQKLSKCNQ